MIMSLSEQLRQYNRWRRGDDTAFHNGECPNPTEIGRLLEDAAERLEALEREHAKFFDNWHEERRKREAIVLAIDRCHRMLISGNDVEDALFQSEAILREAIAKAKQSSSKK